MLRMRFAMFTMNNGWAITGASFEETVPIRQEIVIETFAHRCPYCDAEAVHDPLPPGEHEVTCSHCRRSYIRIVADPVIGRPDDDAAVA
jgi:hypothetical protein